MKLFFYLNFDDVLTKIWNYSKQDNKRQVLLRIESLKKLFYHFIRQKITSTNKLYNLRHTKIQHFFFKKNNYLFKEYFVGKINDEYFGI